MRTSWSTAGTWRPALHRKRPSCSFSVLSGKDANKLIELSSEGRVTYFTHPISQAPRNDGMPVKSPHYRLLIASCWCDVPLKNNTLHQERQHKICKLNLFVCIISSAVSSQEEDRVSKKAFCAAYIAYASSYPVQLFKVVQLLPSHPGRTQNVRNLTISREAFGS